MKVVRETENNEEEEQRRDSFEETAKTGSELPEECYHGLEDLPWNLNSLEQTLYLSLPAWIQRALLCNLAEHFGIWTFHNNILPCRLISYILLPYTLPATAVFSVIYRFLCWAKQIPYQIWSCYREFREDMTDRLRFSLTHLRGLLPNRFPQSLVSMLAMFVAPWSHLPPICFLPFPILPLSAFSLLSLALRFLAHCRGNLTSKNQPAHKPVTQPLWSRRQSVLCFQLSGSGGYYETILNLLKDDEPTSSTFSVLLNLELDMYSHSETLLQNDKLDFKSMPHLDLECKEEDDNLSSPQITYMDMQEEEEIEEQSIVVSTANVDDKLVTPNA